MEKRQTKAIKLFKEGKVKINDKNKWIVEGSRKYHVKKLDLQTWTCTCEDHLYRFETCKHIRAAKLDELQAKKQGAAKKKHFFNNKLKNLKIKKRAINERISKILKENRQIMRETGSLSNDLRKEHHRQEERLRKVEQEIIKLSPKPKTIIIG